MNRDPIDRIVWKPATDLHANDWNPNRVFTPELRLLKDNLLSIGWVQPILVNPNDMIIDGFHRTTLTLTDPDVQARWDGMVPCSVLDLPDDEAMALTVRMNRAKGTHVAVHMHTLVARLLGEHGWDRQRVARAIGATVQEVDVLAKEGVFAIKGIDKWAYSKAWYPAETGTRTQDDVPDVERDDDDESAESER